MKEQQQIDPEVEAGLQAIQEGIERFLAGDWAADWQAPEPMTAKELIISLMGVRLSTRAIASLIWW